MAKIIGFTTQFYTLWEHESETIYQMAPSGQYIATGIKHKYFYIKNISKDLQKVRELYPSSVIDENLRGMYHSFDRQEKIDLPAGMIDFGKYKFLYARDIVKIDLPYILWLVENCYNPKLVEYCKQLPQVIEHYAKIQADKDAILAGIETFKDGDNLVTFGCNPNYVLSNILESEVFPEIKEYQNYHYSSIETGNDNYIALALFSDVKTVDGMYPYNMAIIGGKPKKVKNKQLSVNLKKVFSITTGDSRIYQVFLVQ